MSKKKKELTERQAAFVDQFMILKNAEKAAIAAGFSEPSYGRELRTLPHVKEAIVQRVNSLSKKADITALRILEEEKHLALSDPGEIFDPEGTLIAPYELPESIRRAISAIDVIEKLGRDEDGEETLIERRFKYRFWDKGKALERLEKHKGMYERDNAQRMERPQMVFNFTPSRWEPRDIAGVRKVVPDADVAQETRPKLVKSGQNGPDPDDPQLPPDTPDEAE